MVLGLTPLGIIPIGPLNATILHVPVIIGAVLEGPVVGFVIGLIFGCSASTARRWGDRCSRPCS